MFIFFRLLHTEKKMSFFGFRRVYVIKNQAQKNLAFFPIVSVDIVCKSNPRYSRWFTFTIIFYHFRKFQCVLLCACLSLPAPHTHSVMQSYLRDTKRSFQRKKKQHTRTHTRTHLQLQSSRKNLRWTSWFFL